MEAYKKMPLSANISPMYQMGYKWIGGRVLSNEGEL